MFDFLCYQPSESYLPNPAPTAFVRVVNAAPFSRRVDIYSNGHLIGKNLSYKKLTPYMTVPSGQHNISIYPAGKKTNLVTSKNIIIETNSVCTIAISGSSESEIFLIPDPNVIKKPQTSKIRFVNLSYDSSALDIVLPKWGTIFNGFGYKDISDYIPLPADKYTFQIKLSETEKNIVTVPDVILKEEWNYTIYTMGFTDGKPGLSIQTLLDGSTYINRLHE